MPDYVASIPRRRGTQNKPKNNRWRQQKLPAYRPLLTPLFALPITFLLAIVFISIGVTYYLAAVQANEFVIDYTSCSTSTAAVAHRNHTNANICSYTFLLDSDFTGPILFQYGLDNFYQNERHYMKSRSDRQLFGEINITSGCEPFATITTDGIERAIVPCGSIANSLFNDTFKLLYQPLNQTKWEVVPFSVANVIWSGERERKFRNPLPPPNHPLCDAFIGTEKPPSWLRPVCELGSDDPVDGVGIALENIDLIVWMSPAALPKFRKNFRSLNQSSVAFRNGLPRGTYRLIINDNYPAATFGGQKRFIISRMDRLETAYSYQRVAFPIAGCFFLLFFVVLIVLHCCYPSNN